MANSDCLLQGALMVVCNIQGSSTCLSVCCWLSVTSGSPGTREPSCWTIHGPEYPHHWINGNDIQRKKNKRTSEWQSSDQNRHSSGFQGDKRGEVLRPCNWGAWAYIPHPYLSGQSPDDVSAEVCSFLVGIILVLVKVVLWENPRKALNRMPSRKAFVS